jgi:hypothetical protein
MQAALSPASLCSHDSGLHSPRRVPEWLDGEVSKPTADARYSSSIDGLSQFRQCREVPAKRLLLWGKSPGKSVGDRLGIAAHQAKSGRQLRGVPDLLPQLSRRRGVRRTMRDVGSSCVFHVSFTMTGEDSKVTSSTTFAAIDPGSSTLLLIPLASWTLRRASVTVLGSPLDF